MISVSKNVSSARIDILSGMFRVIRQDVVTGDEFPNGDFFTKEKAFQEIDNLTHQYGGVMNDIFFVCNNQGDVVFKDDIVLTKPASAG